MMGILLAAPPSSCGKNAVLTDLRALLENTTGHITREAVIAIIERHE